MSTNEQNYIAANNNYNNFEYNLYLELNKNVSNYDFFHNPYIYGIFGLSIEHSKKYIQQIQTEFPSFNIKEFTEEISNFNKIGNPDIFYSHEFNLNVSPNLLRYIYHALLISKYLPNSCNIIEIGGGYGGLCYWLQKVNKNIKSYTILDLAISNKIQDECLKYLKTPCNFCSNVKEFKKDNNNPMFVISNYGFSEFNSYYQQLYTDNIIKFADAGFMIWNNWSGVYNFTDKKLNIESERPYFEDLKNLFISF